MTRVPGLRSPYETVSGVVYFGRMVDKIRLHARGALPAEYHALLGGGFDLRCCTFFNVEYKAFAARALEGGSEEELLQWCHDNGRKPSAEEVENWGDFMRKRGWRDSGSGRLAQMLEDNGIGHRREIGTFFDLIEVDEGRPPRNPLY